MFSFLDLWEPEFQPTTRSYAAAVEAAIGAVLEAATEAGEVDPHRVDRTTAEAIHATYHGALITWGTAGHDGNSAGYVRRHLLRVTRFLLDSPR